jgi:cell wall-associated NlpC family hydrolase
MRICDARGAALGLLVLVLAFLSGCASRGGDQGLSGRRAEVVLAGLSQIGTPYVYGGASPAKGFDCSGLTQYAHHVAGLTIPRIAEEQRRASQPIRVGRPGPGDMVFFRTGPGVYHVGLMVDKERFVHASTSRQQVRLDRLDTPYWTARYLGAGTYLK